MKITMHRGFCDAGLSYCARCSASFFRKPQGTDRPCIVKVVDDGQETVEVVLCTDQRNLRFELTAELQQALAVEGWEYLADFEPAFVRRGAHKRWQACESRRP